MDRFIGIGEAAKILGVSVSTVRRWADAGKINMAVTEGRHRRFDITELKPELTDILRAPRRTVAYGRVSTPEQKEELRRQQEMLEMFCARNGWEYELITDIGSGVNMKNKGLSKVIDLLLADKVSRLVVTHKDRLLRIGSDLLFALCKAKDVDVVILNNGQDTVREKDLVEDVRELVAAS